MDTTSNFPFEREARLRDYVAAIKLMVALVGIPIYVFYAFVDARVFGFRVDFLICRIQFIALSILLFVAMTRGAFNKRPNHLFLLVMASNLVSVTYQVASTGGQHSEYIYGFAQSLMVCLMVPLFPSDFLITMGGGLFLQILAFLFAAHWDAGAILGFPLMNNIIFCMIASLAYVSVERMRRRLYQNLARNEDLMATQAETISRQSRELARTQTAAAVGRASQMLAHDVRRPLTMLRGMVDALRSRPSLEAREELLRECVPDVERALVQVDAMVEDVMEASTERPLKVKDVRIEELLLSTLWGVFRERAYDRTSPHMFRWNLAHATAVAIDLPRMTRALVNIVANAIEAVPQGTELSFVSRQLATGEVELKLANTGSYIPPAALSRLFDDGFTSGKEQGTGLGLAITQRIIARHGGQVSCASTRNETNPQGLVEFRVVLPAGNTIDPSPESSSPPLNALELRMFFSSLNDIDESAWERDPSKPGIEIDDEPSTELRARLEGRMLPLRVLIVDDEAVYRAALQGHLSELQVRPGCVELRIAGSLESALEAVEDWMPHLAILDLDLGHSSKTGLDIARRLKSHRPAPFIVLHTNRLVNEDHRILAESSIDRAVPKPADRRSIHAIIGSTLDRNRPRIAILDDSTTYRTTWRIALEKAAEVACFSSPDDFLAQEIESSDAAPFDAILSDQHFGSESATLGSDFLVKMRQRGFKGLLLLCSNEPNLEIPAGQGVFVVPKAPCTWRELVERATPK